MKWFTSYLSIYQLFNKSVKICFLEKYHFFPGSNINRYKSSFKGDKRFDILLVGKQLIPKIFRQLFNRDRLRDLLVHLTAHKTNKVL